MCKAPWGRFADGPIFLTGEFDRAIASGQARLEGIDDTRDAFHQLMERWDDRLTLADPRLQERYLKFKLLIRVYFRVRLTGIKHVACFERFCGGCPKKEVGLGQMSITSDFS